MKLQESLQEGYKADYPVDDGHRRRLHTSLLDEVTIARVACLAVYELQGVRQWSGVDPDPGPSSHASEAAAGPRAGRPRAGGPRAGGPRAGGLRARRSRAGVGEPGGQSRPQRRRK